MTQTNRNERRAMLFSGEERRQIAGLPLLSYVRQANPGKPFLIFLTGGGVLARVAYGHPEGDRRDFLDHWLAEAGWGLIAASYPCDHPVFDREVVDLQLEDWASAQAALVADVLHVQGWRPIVAAGWSMGGRLVFALTRALRQHGLHLDCFVSLSGTPPFPRLTKEEVPPERLLANGLWDIAGARRDGTTRDERWLRELDRTGAREGRPVIAPTAFADLYRANVPYGLWGPELEDYFHNEPPRDLPGSFRKAGSFSGVDYPICSAIVPLDRSDFRHALTDLAVWGSITVSGIVPTLPASTISALSEDEWSALRKLVIEAPQRLTRYLSGGHFFSWARRERKARSTC
jgi:pimeloyl-ACP methyl ester carboxylesterase